MQKQVGLLIALVAYTTAAFADAYQQAFDAMSDDLANPGKSFAFVKAAIRKGDLSGAVAALERIERINPTLANIQLELGVLYLRLGAPDIAQQYIEASLRSPDVPVWVRNRAKNLLDRAKRSTNRHRVSFALRGMSHYDNNANAAPVNREVLVGGVEGLLDEDDTGRDDTSWDISTGLQYSYALNSESGNEIETYLSTYHRRYEKSGELDVNSASLDVGPRLYFGQVVSPSASIRPYAVGAYLELAGEKYLESVGGGVNVRRVFSSTLLGDLFLEYRDQDYFDTSRRQAADRSGVLYTVRGQLTYVIDPSKLLAVSFVADNRDSRQDWESRDRVAVRLSYTQAFAPIRGERNWRATVSVAAENLEYDVGDPAVDPDTAREDDRVVTALSVTIPIARSVNLLVGTSYTDVDSSLPNFQYDNWGGSLGFRVAL